MSAIGECGRQSGAGRILADFRPPPDSPRDGGAVMRSVCWVLAAAAAAGVSASPAHCETANALFVADGRCFAGSASGAVSMVVERIESDGAAVQLLVAEAESGLAAAPVDHYRFRSCDLPYFAWRPDALARGSLRVTAIDVESGAVIGRALRVPSARGDIWAPHVGPVPGEPGTTSPTPRRWLRRTARIACGWPAHGLVTRIFAAGGPGPAGFTSRGRRCAAGGTRHPRSLPPGLHGHRGAALRYAHGCTPI